MKIMQMTRCGVLSLSLILLIPPSSPAQTTYYVDPTGSDSNDGRSPSSAWQTVSKVDGSSFQFGDRIQFKRGGVWKEILRPPSSGSSGSPIVFSAYGSGARPVISAMDDIAGAMEQGNWSDQGGNVWYKSSIAHWPGRVWLSGTEANLAQVQGDLSSTYRWYSSGSGLYLYSTSNPATNYSTIVESNGRTSGVIVSGQNYITLRSLDIRGGEPCVDVDGSDYLVVDSCTVLRGAANGRGVYVHNGSNNGEIKNSTLDYLTADYNPSSVRYFYYGGRSNFGSAPGDAIGFFDGANSWSVHDCYVAGGSHSAINLATCSNILIYANEFHGGYKPIDSHGEVLTSDCQIYRNYIHRFWIRNQIAGIGNKWYYNIIDTMGYMPYEYDPIYHRVNQNSGMGFWDSPCHDNSVWNNVIMNCAGPGITLEPGVYNSHIENNLIYNTGTLTDRPGTAYVGITTKGGATPDSTGHPNYFRNNFVYNLGLNGFAYRQPWDWIQPPNRIGASAFNSFNGYGGDVMTGNIDVEDPQLDVNYKISSSSPCLDAGIDVGLTSDYWGNAVPYNGLPDIGVHEWRQAGTGAVTLPAVPGLVSPADGATGLSATVVLTWSVSTNAVEYQVQVSSDQQFGSTLIDERSIKGTTFTVGPLAYGATFHWRVRATNANGTSPYSVARTFSIAALQIQLRGHDISTEGVPVAFITNPRGSGSRSLEVIRDGVMPPVGSNDPSLAYDTFTGGQRSFDWIGYTFSSPHVFSRLLFQEGIRYRDQGGWFADLKVQVRASGQWNDVQGIASNPSYPATGGDSYVMYGLEFPPVVGDGIRIAGTPGGLAQFVSCAELRAFDTTANALSSPRVEYPVASSTDVPTVLNVRWTTVSGAIAYHLQISPDAAFGTLVVNDSSLTDTLRSVGPLAHAATYFCRVRARYGAIVSTFSQVVNFTTVDALTVLPSPQIVSPVTGSGNLPTSLTIRWTRSNGAARFHLQLATDPAFATVVLNDTALTDTVRPVGPLAYGSVFYCRVRAKSGAFVSLFSPVVGFATADYSITTPFAAPVLAAPENGATVEPPTIALYWKGVENATRYHVQVSEDDAFVRLAIDTTVANISIRVFAPKTRVNYYWRVQARDGEDVHVYSEVRRFLTSGPKSTEMEQNYPNPFNPSTIITYYIEREGAVLLKVFNILGQEVATIVDAVQPAGFHRIVFDIGALGRGKGVASGVYFCRLTTENYVETRKMLLRK